MPDVREKQEEISMEEKIICNCCGEEIRVERGIPVQDYLHIKKEWGYFSGKDGKIQQVVLCEACWDNISSQFRIPASATEVTELI